jgi:DNA-binding HxlR family transcriptional regulator
MRTYDDGCAAAHELDLVGERWALLVVRGLSLGPKPFTALRASLPGVSPNVLAQRPRELESVGAVRRGKLPPPAASRSYELTEWGLELEPVVVSLGHRGARSPWRSREAALEVDSLVFSFRTTFDPQAAEGLETSYELRLGEDRFREVVDEDRVEIVRGAAERPDAIVEAEDAAVLRALVYEEGEPDEVLRSGDVRIEDDRQAVARFLTLFPLPEPAALAGT